MGELEHALGPPQSLQVMLAEVAQLATGGQPVHDQGGRGRRQEHLAAMPGGHDPRGAVESRAEVVALARRGLAHVQAHADAERPGLAPRLARERALGVQAGADPVDGRVEDGHEPVADRFHDLPTGGLDAVTEDRVVALERALHRLLVVLPELGAAFHVREHEGQRSGRLLGTRIPHSYGHAVSICVRTSPGAQAGAQSLEFGVGDNTAPVQLRQLPQRLGGVRGLPGRRRGRGPLGLGLCLRESIANRLLGPAPALTRREPRVEVVGASRDGDVADHLAEKCHWKPLHSGSRRRCVSIMRERASMPA